MRKRLPIVIDQLERPPNLGFPHTLGLVRYPLPRHALFLECEVRVQSAGGCHEEDRGRQVERLRAQVSKSVSRLVRKRYSPQ